jgi:hypothetical protein
LKRRNVLILTLSLLTLLSASSVIAISQAWWPMKPKSEYVGYEVEGITGAATITYVDTSDAPNIIIESIFEDIVEFTITIDGNMYSYPEDFDIISTHYAEFNAATGTGFTRVEGAFIFKLPGRPTLNYNVVSRTTGFKMAPDGTLLTPGDIRIEGDMKVSGNRMFNKAEGFGLTESYYVAPEYTQMYHHQFGVIKGWPL